MTSKEALKRLYEHCDTQEELEIIKKDLEILKILKTKQIDIRHLATLCNCCGYDVGLSCYNDVPAHKAITLEELVTIMGWLKDDITRNY